MAADNPAFDTLPFKLDTKFYENHVVAQKKTGASWWQSWAKWKWVKDLGAGGFGVVYLEREEGTGNLRAVKRMDGSKLRLQNINVQRELQTLIAMRNHDRFVEFLGWYQDQNFIYLAMEYIEHGDLEQYIDTLGTGAKKNAREITQQVLEGLVELHSKKICHRDLKPQNILIASLSPIRIKLADFGTSKPIEGTMLRTRCGTTGYQAPELLGLLHNRGTNYSNSVDIWALGCLVFKILTLKTPFMEISLVTETSETGVALTSFKSSTPHTDMKLFQEYCSGIADFPVQVLSPHVGEWGVDFVKRCLNPDPELRVTLMDALNHEWVIGLEALQSQFVSLGVLLSLEEVKTLILKRKSTPGADISMFFPPTTISDIPRLAVAAASSGYVLATEVILGILGARFKDMKQIVVEMLQAAAGGGHLEIVSLLMEKDTGINVYSTGRTALQEAAGGGYLEVVRFLVEKGVNINTYFSGRTALQAAAGGGHLEVVILLIEMGADINAEPAYYSGRTALQAAAGGGHLEVVILLMEEGADINAEPAYSSGRTALQAASEGGHREIVILLIEKGADITAKPAYCSGRRALQAAAEGGHLEVVILLMEEGAGINAEPAASEGLTALQAAAKGGHLDVVRHLVKKGAYINAEPAYFSGRTALQAAAGGGHLEVAILLMEKGADINAEPAYCSGRTALQAAAGGGHLEVVILLVEKGADINAKSVYSSGRTALQAAAEGGHLEAVRLLLEKGADINAGLAYSSGRTALQAAAGGGHLKVVILLMEEGACINAEPAFLEGRTALQAAVEGGHLETVILLMEKGVDINAKPAYFSGRTALQAAAEGGHLEVVRLLVEKGSDINAEPAVSEGLTALQAAVGCGHLEIVRLLLGGGAHVNASGWSGTALDIAMLNGEKEIQKLLSDVGAE